MSNYFDELLESLQEDTEKSALKNLATKYPEIKNGFLRQGDYSKNMNTLAEERKQVKADREAFESEKGRIEADLDKLTKWNDWRLNNWDDDKSMTKAELKKVAEIESLTSELETLKSAQEAGMTFEEVGLYLDKELGKKNLVSRDYLDKEFRKDLVDKSTYEKDLNAKVGATANGMEYLYDSTLPAVLSHKDEFGEVIKPSDIIKYANENKIPKIEDAYERMVAPRRAEIAGKKNEEAITKAREEGKAEALKERSMGTNGHRPVDEGAPVMGHLEKRLRGPKDESADKQLEGPLGTLGNQIADRYRREKAEGKTEAVIAQFGRVA